MYIIVSLTSTKCVVFINLHLDDSVISVSLLFIMSMLFVHTARAVCSSCNLGCIFCGLSKLSSSWENCFVH